MSDSFIYTLPLNISRVEEKELEKRLDAARQIYNAALGEALKRLKLYRESKDWQKARRLAKSDKKKRKELFRKVQTEYAFSEYSLHTWIKSVRMKCSLKEHVDSSTMQKETTKAFSAVKEYALGKRGRPRFRGKDRFRSIEGKSNKSGIRFIEGKVIWNIKKAKKLSLSPLFDRKDTYGIEANAMIAVVSKSQSFLKPFCHELSDKAGQKKRLQQKVSRSLRVNNPENFDEKGAKKWVRSKRYRPQSQQCRR